MSLLIVLAEGAAPASFRFLAADAPPAPLPADAPAPNPLANLILPLLLLGVFFLVFAPQMKRNKQHQKLLTELKSGDEVVTTGGIYGTIVQVKPGRFIIEIAKGMRVEINRANVEARAPGEDAPADDKKA